jgi:hypothetical protein
MKKLPTASPAILFLTIILFANCNKSSNISNAVGNTTSSKSVDNLHPGTCPYNCHDLRCEGYVSGYCGPDTIAIIQNVNNVYNYIGAQHNSGVQYVLNVLGEPSSNNTLVLNTETNYLNKLGYTTGQVDSAYNQGESNGLLPFTKIPELDSLGNIMYSKGLISSTANSYIQQIYTIASDYLSTTVSLANYSSDSSSYASFASQLVTLESKIKMIQG